jgi:hypothetical protein
MTKRSARQHMADDGDTLFEACWRHWLRNIKPHLATDQDPENPLPWLEIHASKLVNDPKSRFYIHKCRRADIRSTR